MGIVKKAKKYREGGDVPCPPGSGGKCRPSSGGSSRTMKTEGYKPGKSVRMTKKEERASEYSAEALKPYERDFPGDVAPGGFGGDSQGKKSTRWRTTEKKGIGYVGQATKGKSGIKVAKKVVKKAKVGTKVIKSKKK